jgi:large conductance mechanosensitive channel
MLNEFKAFIAKGNVMDLAVGIIIGAAFTAIVGSLVADLIQPLLGLILGNIDFSAIKLGPFMIGNFITAVINFLIIAFVVFLLVKAMNKMMPKKEEAPAAPAGPTELDVLKEIRDALKK